MIKIITKRKFKAMDETLMEMYLDKLSAEQAVRDLEIENELLHREIEMLNKELCRHG